MLGLKFNTNILYNIAMTPIVTAPVWTLLDNVLL